MSKIWFSSDTHFHHENIVKYCNRPFKSVEEMDETLFNNWNSVVSPEDIVYFLGDLTMYSNSSKVNNILSKLNGNIIWIKGNHDRKPILTKAFINYGGVEWELVHNPEDATTKHVLCGHIHEAWRIKRTKKGRTIINVGVDVWDFKPITIKQILKAKDLKKE